MFSIFGLNIFPDYYFRSQTGASVENRASLAASRHWQGSPGVRPEQENEKKGTRCPTGHEESFFLPLLPVLGALTLCSSDGHQISSRVIQAQQEVVGLLSIAQLLLILYKVTGRKQSRESLRLAWNIINPITSSKLMHPTMKSNALFSINIEKAHNCSHLVRELRLFIFFPVLHSWELLKSGRVEPEEMW